MANHLVFIIMDSCRYDSFMRANTPNVDRLGTVEARWSYASWTAPSHYAMLMGLMPHQSPRRVYASDVYKQEFVMWRERLGLEGMEFRTFLPEISLPKVLRDHGYRCIARVSMPVLNSFTLLNRYFDDYRLMDDHNDFAGMVEEISFPEDQPCFYFLNLGETHYPYMLPREEMPHISGVHGVYKTLARQGRETEAAAGSGQEFFDRETMQRLHTQQVRCVEYIDGLIGRLFEKCPDNTHLIVTSDHGELFGEDDLFGHGPVMHEKCFQVPFVEGKRPAPTSPDTPA